jgi:hypothetical protein
MNKAIVVVAVIILILHGLIHLMGTTVYMKLGSVSALPYKTALLGGRLQVGESGMAIFGALWALAALGFVATAIGLFADWSWWRPALIGVTLLSLLLTVLDMNVAIAGVLVNLAILIVMWASPRLSTLLAR